MYVYIIFGTLKKINIIYKLKAGKTTFRHPILTMKYLNRRCIGEIKEEHVSL